MRLFYFLSLPGFPKDILKLVRFKKNWFGPNIKAPQHGVWSSARVFEHAFVSREIIQIARKNPRGSTEKNV